MSAVINERFDSRASTVGGSPSVTLKYSVTGTENDGEVLALVAGTAPSEFAGLKSQSFSIDPQGGGVWEAEVKYGPMTSPMPPETGDSVFNFDIATSTQHITQSLETKGSFVASGTAPDYKGAIGVNGDMIEGTDIVLPHYNFSETHYLDISIVNGGYKANLFQVAGRVNQSAFRGFAAGEVLFLGAQGSLRGEQDWEIAFKFSASPNVSDLTLGDISGISKDGWDYLWVTYEDAESQQTLVKQPKAIYVERVYERANFGLLGIGS